METKIDKKLVRKIFQVDKIKIMNFVTNKI